MKAFPIAAAIFLISMQLFAQDINTRRTTMFRPGLLEIRESANYGLVFRGPELGFGMNWTFPRPKNNLLVYEYKLALATPFSKEIIGVNLSFKPVELMYLWATPIKKLNLKIGPALKIEYNLQFYPDLQSGYDFWLTNYNSGIALYANWLFSESGIKLKFYNSIIGFISRNVTYRNPYFFNTGFREVLTDVNSHLRFIHPMSFNNTSLEIRFQRGNSARFYITYVFDYFSYSKNPEIQILSNSLKFNFIPRDKK